MRTDTHRPSEIVPDEYEFVELGYEPGDNEPGAVLSGYVMEKREHIHRHKNRTGGKRAAIDNFGCDICGAANMYYAVFYHEPSNEYIHTGLDCAAKLWTEHESAFKAFRSTVAKQNADARANKAGKAKAQLIFQDLELDRALDISQIPCDEVRKDILNHFQNPYWTIRDIVEKVIKYGNEPSEKACIYLAKLVNLFDNFDAINSKLEAKRAEERANAMDLPAGREVVTGKVVSQKWRDNDYGGAWKILVKDDRGFKVYGNIPSAIAAGRYDEDGDPDVKGLRVTFTATLKPSRDDAKFGFYSRPTKASVL